MSSDTVDWRFLYRDLLAAKQALRESLDDVAADNPEMPEDMYAADIVEGVALNCTPAVAIELCRTELGFIPEGLKHLRPELERRITESEATLRWAGLL